MTQFWESSLESTIEKSIKLYGIEGRQEAASNWLSTYESDKPTSSNQGVDSLAFQRWFGFKEAFSPKFVADIITSRPYEIDRCLDPFGGSGTTALTTRMFGLRSVSSEVNPFLADLILSKLTPVDAAGFEKRVMCMLQNLSVTENDKVLPQGFPPTFTEPGVGGRYIFNREVFGTARSILRASKALGVAECRLVKVLLGSILIENSNVRISGKGRRYRKNWQARIRTRDSFLQTFREAMDQMIEDLVSFKSIPKGDHRVLIGDSRQTLSRVRKADIALFSPPYPNSFDYTDVYNVELWMLDYLTTLAENRILRQATLRSHVQTKWSTVGTGNFRSEALNRTTEALRDNADKLWDKNIPNMISGYFVDLHAIFQHLRRILPKGQDAIVVAGNSRYAGILIDIAKILPQVVSSLGFEVETQNTIRAMRSSPQHGGKLDLAEHCTVFRKTCD